MSYTYNQFCSDIRSLERQGYTYYRGYNESHEKKLIDDLWKEFPEYAERYSDDTCY